MYHVVRHFFLFESLFCRHPKGISEFFQNQKRKDRIYSDGDGSDARVPKKIGCQIPGMRTAADSLRQMHFECLTETLRLINLENCLSGQIQMRRERYSELLLLVKSYDFRWWWSSRIFPHHNERLQSCTMLDIVILSFVIDVIKFLQLPLLHRQTIMSQSLEEFNQIWIE